MPFEFTDEQKMLRQTIRKIALDKVAPETADREEKKEYPWDMAKIFRDHGLFGLSFPEEYGGVGGGLVEHCIAVEEISRACNNCGGMLSLTALASSAIMAGGSEDQKKKYISHLTQGEAGCFALTEPRGGSDASHLESTATFQDGHYVLNGTKIFASQFDVAKIVVITARTNPQEKGSKGISCFVLEKDMGDNMPGIINARRLPKISMQAIHTYEFTMDNLKIPKENLIGKENEGFKIITKGLGGRGRTSTAANALGSAQATLDFAAKYARGRIAFGQPIGTFQGIQFKLADMATQIEAARQLVYMAAYYNDIGNADSAMYASMAKLFATDLAMKCATEACQILGGYSYLTDYPLAKRMLDGKLFQLLEGTSEIQRGIIGRSIMDGWSRP
jgi:alkylation response protein AidB-like acyl-CoA dehydrogenase